MKTLAISGKAGRFRRQCAYGGLFYSNEPDGLRKGIPPQNSTVESSYTIESLAIRVFASLSMAIIAAANLLRSTSLFHLTIAYFLLVSPSIIVDQNLVFILGEAMRIVSTFSVRQEWFSV